MSWVDIVKMPGLRKANNASLKPYAGWARARQKRGDHSESSRVSDKGEGEREQEKVRTVQNDEPASESGLPAVNPRARSRSKRARTKRVPEGEMSGQRAEDGW